MQDEAVLAGLGQLFESITPEDLQKLRQAQEMIYGLEDEELADMSDVLDAAADDPEVRAELEREVGTRLPDDSLTLLNALVKSTMPQTEGYMPRQGMYDGGLASLGRGGDTMMAHITPGEAHLLRSRGGSGTINPRTGQPEFIFKAIGSALKSVGKVVRQIAPIVLPLVLPGVGAIAGVLGKAGAAALGGGLGTLIAGGSPRQALQHAAMTFAGAAVLGGVSNVMSGGDGGFMAGAKAAVSPTAARSALDARAAERAVRTQGKDPTLWDRAREGGSRAREASEAYRQLVTKPTAAGTDSMTSLIQQQLAAQGPPFTTEAEALAFVNANTDADGNLSAVARDRLLSPRAPGTGGASGTGGAGGADRSWWQKTKDFFDPRSDWRGNRPPSLGDAYRLTDSDLPEALRTEEARRLARGAPLWQRALPLAGAGLAVAAATGGTKAEPADTSAIDEYRAWNDRLAQHRRDNPEQYRLGWQSLAMPPLAPPMLAPWDSRLPARQGGSPSAYIVPSARMQKYSGGGGQIGDMGMGDGHFSGMGIDSYGFDVAAGDFGGAGQGYDTPGSGHESVNSPGFVAAFNDSGGFSDSGGLLSSLATMHTPEVIDDSRSMLQSLMDRGRDAWDTAKTSGKLGSLNSTLSDLKTAFQIGAEKDARNNTIGGVPLSEFFGQGGDDSLPLVRELLAEPEPEEALAEEEALAPPRPLPQFDPFRLPEGTPYLYAPPSVSVADLGARFARGRQRMQMGGKTPDGLDLPYNNHMLPQTPYGPRITGPVLGPQRPTDDNIAAALHPNEFVFTTEAVKGAGNGNTEKGIQAMYDLMHRLERRAGGRA